MSPSTSALSWTTRDAAGVALVGGVTKVLTNSVSVAERLDKTCAGGHRRAGGYEDGARSWPRRYCDVILDGIQIEAAGRREADGVDVAHEVADYADTTREPVKPPGRPAGAKTKEECGWLSQ